MIYQGLPRRWRTSPAAGIFPRRTRTIRGAALLGAVALASCGCGSALSMSQIAAAAHGNGVSSGTAPGGGQSSGGQLGSGATQSGSASQTATAVGGAGAAGSGSLGAPTTTGVAAAGPGGASGGGSGPAGGDHAPILIGSVGDYSGAPGAVLAYEAETVQVWAKWENAHGGVDGHQIQVIVEDDGGDPSHYQSDVEDLVNNKHVLAFVDNGANLTAQAGQSFLESKQVPVIGAGDGNSAWTSSPMYFNLQSPTDALIGGELKQAKDQFHVTKVGVMACVESQSCAAYYNDTPRLAAQLGMTVVYSARISITQPDFTSECLQAQSSGAQVVEGIGDENTFHRIVDSCSRQGYHPDYVAPSPNDGDGQVSGLANVVSANGAFPFDGDVSNPAVQEYLSAFKAYASNSILSQYTALSWAAAKLFQHVIDTSIGTGTPSTPKILAGLWSINGFTTSGLSLPLTYHAHAANAGTPNCWFPLSFSNGHWTGPDGLTPQCDNSL